MREINIPGFFYNIDSSSRKGTGIVNEDQASWTKDWAWVLDGATPIEPFSMGSYQTQAQWLAETCQQIVRDLVETHKSLSMNDILVQSAKTIQQTWQKSAHDRCLESSAAIPSLTLAIVTIAGEHLSMGILGDCSVYILTTAGDVEIFTDTRVSVFEQKTLKVLQDYPEGELRTRKVKEQRKANREQMNKPDGYWVLTPTSDWYTQVRNFTYPATDIVSVLLCTDGFDRLFSLYDAVDPLDVLRYKLSLDHCQELLRDIERNDPQCTRYPRTKQSDDSTALRFTLQPAPGFHA